MLDKLLVILKPNDLLIYSSPSVVYSKVFVSCVETWTFPHAVTPLDDPPLCLRVSPGRLEGEPRHLHERAEEPAGVWPDHPGPRSAHRLRPPQPQPPRLGHRQLRAGVRRIQRRRTAYGVDRFQVLSS